MSTREKDEETLLFDLVDLVKANLGAKLTEINACKNDNITLEDLPSSRYLDSLSEEALNYDRFIYYGISNMATSGGPRTATEVSIFFDIVFVDDQLNSNNGGGNMLKYSLRYTKAVKEVIEENFRNIKYASGLEVSALAPVSLQSLEEDTQDAVKMKVAGVKVKASIV